MGTLYSHGSQRSRDMSKSGRPLDLSKTPWNAMRIFEEAARKEEQERQNAALRRAATAPQSLLRAPSQGEQVMLTHINRKPHLNGSVAEVLGTSPDPKGM